MEKLYEFIMSIYPIAKEDYQHLTRDFKTKVFKKR